MTALSSYSTGTVSVGAGGTTVTGVGTIWNDGSAKPGDILQIGNFQSVISDVTDGTHLVIPPWGGGAQAGVAYKIWQVSPQRFAGAEAMATVNKLVAAFNTTGFFVFVSSIAIVPDPSLGDDGQYALQPTTGKMWVKTGGAWVYLGIFKAFQLTGAWSGATAYEVGDVVTLSGSSYVCVLDHTNHTPPNTTYWQLLASKGDTGATGAVPYGTPAAWVTGHSYVAGPPADLVTHVNGSLYQCLASHTSGTFPADLAAGKWLLIVHGATNGTSVTSLAIGTGSKAFVTQIDLFYKVGARIRATSAANPSNWMEGVVTAYSQDASGATLTINIDKTNGSGTFADWNFNIVGQPGAVSYPIGSIIDSAYAEYTASTSITAIIPTDDTVPQSDEGAEILAASITPKSTTNKLRVRFSGECAPTNADNIIAALFLNSETAARAARYCTQPAGFGNLIMVEHEFVPGATTTQTVHVRVGAAVGPIRFNGNASGRLFGGVNRTTLVIEEIVA
ncbi:carbohydrate-binding protein [Bradyrhizobium sp. 147]|uniref:carbohydrate-binding protein n=1 Tax=Bradyrhizobium sp. 147 TaxID=2782623 RepID=UPI001FF73E6A|nr:carbohydrate-binding protein [Bradyrhizobium sp. 147]